jgi:hypothetical protein
MIRTLEAVIDENGIARLLEESICLWLGRGDWLLCQITSNPYSDARAVQLADADFRTGSLRVISNARPSKLFTTHHSLITSEI